MLIGRRERMQGSQQASRARQPGASAGLEDEANAVKNCGAAARRPAALAYSAATGCG